MSSFNFQEAVDYLVDSMEAPNLYPALLLMGNMGLGKSAVPRVAANIIAERKKAKCHVVDMRLAHCDNGDIKGMPEKGNGYTFYEKGTWFPMHAEDRESLRKSLESLNRVMMSTGMENDYFFIFLDEMNRAPRDVQQAVFQLVYDRSLDEVRLSDRAVVLSAINDNSDLYQTTRVDAALIDRFAAVEFKPSPAEWMDYLASREITQEVHEAIRAFLMAHDRYIDPSPEEISKSTETNRKTYSRRSWTRLGEVLAHQQKLKEEEITEWSESKLARLAASIVGDDAGLKFTRFVADDYQTLSPKEVFNNYSDAISKRIVTARPDALAALADEVCKLLAEAAASEKGFTKAQQKNMFRLCVDMPDEIAKKFIESAKGVKGILAWMKKDDLGPYMRTVGKQSDGSLVVKTFKTPMERFTDIHSTRS
jgi:hypothetical protein